VTRIGLTFDEYVDLRLKPRAGVDLAFHEAAEIERNGMFPMATATASHHLRSQGFDCRPAMLDTLVEHGVVKPSKPDAWTRADVDAAAEHFKKCHIFVPYATMCLVTCVCHRRAGLVPLGHHLSLQVMERARRVRRVEVTLGISR
jgi:hypothetical protein